MAEPSAVVPEQRGYAIEGKRESLFANIRWSAILTMLFRGKFHHFKCSNSRRVCTCSFLLRPSGILKSLVSVYSSLASLHVICPIVEVFSEAEIEIEISLL